MGLGGRARGSEAKPRKYNRVFSSSLNDANANFGAIVFPTPNNQFFFYLRNFGVSHFEVWFRVILINLATNLKKLAKILEFGQFF